MCGIYAFITRNPYFIDRFFLKKETDIKNSKYDDYPNNWIDTLSNLNQKRGPDNTKMLEFRFNNTYFYIAFHRLKIVQSDKTGDQPFVIEKNNKRYILICNGEIYNYKSLVKQFQLSENQSDCYCILELFIEFGLDRTMQLIEGEFCFVLLELDLKSLDFKIYSSRDLFGIRALHYGFTEETMVFGSELKSINPLTIGHVFPPRNYFYSHNLQSFSFRYYYNLATFPHKLEMHNDENEIYRNLNRLLRQAVEKRLQCDDHIEIGCLLSGGLDSSLVSAITAEFLRKRNIRLKTFSIGFENSEDLKYAKVVADFIGSEHYEIVKTEQDFLNEIENVIYVTETYDITTIRASVGQYLACKYVKENTNVKILLIGDGSDELFNGYKYNYLNKDPIAAHYDTLRLLTEIHLYDVLRSDRGISSNGIEGRVPFLDKELVEYVLNVDSKLRMPVKGERMEKYILRKAFDNDNLLPQEVLWRRKEAFSDAVSNVKTKLWYQVIQDWVETLHFENKRYDYLKPVDKESEYYRYVFEQFFPNNYVILSHYWLPRWVNVKNPSARIIDVE